MSNNWTPLRYPGGKQRLTPFISEIIETNSLNGCHYVEPYAGGAGVAIQLLIENKVSCIHLNDISRPVYAFWHSIKNHPQEFCRKISRASLNIDEWKRQREILRLGKSVSLFDLGFAMFYLNRCNRSGIMNAGVIGGLRQDGEWKLDARFYRNELIRRIEAIAEKSKSIRLRNWDAERFMKQYIPRLPKRTLVYCDPPYFNKAETLYENHYISQDHLRISKLIQEDIQVPWIVSYDADPKIMSYYEKHEMFVYSLQYNAARAYSGIEMFAFWSGAIIPNSSSLKFVDCVLAERNAGAVHRVPHRKKS